MFPLRLYYSSDSACPYHRQLLPARFCAPDFAAIGCDIQCGDFAPDGQGWWSVNGLPRPELILDIARHKHVGGKFLWGIDDDMPAIPDWSPAKPKDPHAMSVWQMAKEMADLIVVSTPALADTFKDVAGKVMVAPNLFDLSTFPAWDKGATNVAVSLPIKVGWAGGVTHKGDTEQLSEPLDILLRQIPKGQLQVVWFGPLPPAKLLRDHMHRGLVYQPMEKFPLYQPMLNSIRPDVWLCPLVDIPFNYSKSNIRVLEAWGLQAVPVASPVGEYNAIKSGVDGRYASSTDEWVSAIGRLVMDHNYRLEMARNGRYRVEAEFNWSRKECRKPWDAVFARVFGVQPP